MPDIVSVEFRTADDGSQEPKLEVATLTHLCDLIESGSEEEKRRLGILVEYCKLCGYKSPKPRCIRCGADLTGRPEDHECES